MSLTLPTDYSYAQMLDDLIMVFACRYGADPYYDEEAEDEDVGNNKASTDAGDNNGAAERRGASPGTTSTLPSNANKGNAADAAHGHDHHSTFVAQQGQAWALVAEGVRHHMRHPLTEEERACLLHVDTTMYTAEMCRNRAQYALWRRDQRAEREAAARKEAKAAARRARAGGKTQKVGGAVAACGVCTRVGGGSEGEPFSVIRHSIKDEVDKLYARVRATLPSCADVVLSDSSDEEGDDTNNKNNNNNTDNDTNETNADDQKGAKQSVAPTPANPFDKVKHFYLKSQADVDRDVAVAKAEEELLGKFAALQQEHFQKTRRWVDVPAEMATLEGVKEGTAKKTTAALITSTAKTTVTATVTATSLIPNSAAVPTHQQIKSAAASLAKGGSDAASASASALPPHRAQHVDPASAHASALRTATIAGAPFGITADEDPIAAAKRALNPYAAMRPPRPSETYMRSRRRPSVEGGGGGYGDDNDDDDDEDPDEDLEAFLAANGQDVREMLEGWGSLSPPPRAVNTASASAFAANGPAGLSAQNTANIPSPATAATQNRLHTNAALNRSPPSASASASAAASATGAGAAPATTNKGAVSTSSSSPPNRGTNRWNIVEYESDDEDDEE